MYLRKNRVRSGETRRTYLAIAHNVWWVGETACKPQSRPVIVASFGAEETIDVEIAHDLVGAVERCVPRPDCRRGDGRAAIERVAQEVRRIEPFLRVLASRKLDLRGMLPAEPERSAIFDTLIRAKLAEAEPVWVENEVIDHIRAHFAS